MSELKFSVCVCVCVFVCVGGNLDNVQVDNIQVDNVQADIFCGWGVGNSDNIRARQCPSQTMSELKFSVCIGGGVPQTMSGIPRKDSRRQIQVQTSTSSLPRLILKRSVHLKSADTEKSRSMAPGTWCFSCSHLQYVATPVLQAEVHETMEWKSTADSQLCARFMGQRTLSNTRVCHLPRCNRKV